MIMNNQEYPKIVFSNQVIDSFALFEPTDDMKKYYSQDNFLAELTFENCTINTLMLCHYMLEQHITLKNCTIINLDCSATYFFGGFLMDNCTIRGKALFDCGGHNNNPFIIRQSIFEGFADFFDVYYQAEVQITNNHFKEGTNLFHYIKPPFGIKPGINFRIENNTYDKIITNHLL